MLAMGCKNSTLCLVIKNLGPVFTLKIILSKIFCCCHYFCISFYIRRSNNNFRMRRDITLTRANQGDWNLIIQRIPDFPKKERKEIIRRYRFLKNGFFDSCFLGKNRQNEIVSMQCLIEPRHNELIDKKLRNVWPILKNNEVMLEELYIFPKFRTVGIFPTINLLILKIAQDKGYTGCRSFIRKENILSLNGFLGLGFKIEKLFTQINFLGNSWRFTKPLS